MPGPGAVAGPRGGGCEGEAVSRSSQKVPGGRVFAPFEIGGRLRIVPPGTPLATGSRIDLAMAAGAFGSGEHETTRSCLELLQTSVDPENARVLDLGSGTGILSVAALKLGARSALCVDDDPAAVETCKLNCELNGVGGSVEHVCGTIDRVASSGFELVLANLYGDILLAAAAELLSRASPRASLLLSGILHEDNFDVVRRYRELGCSVLVNRRLEEFTTVLLRRE
jgi:ribosomal protein L11 methyltransferase